MCFGRSLKGDADPAGITDHQLSARPSSKVPTARTSIAMPDPQSPPPAGPPPSYSNLQSNNPYASAARPPSANAQYVPPAGPPPSQAYAPPSGPPPSHSPYTPPSGPPPSQAYEPPSGPPPSQAYAPPSGPPPSQVYAPPSGPPPSQTYAPPSGLPPSKAPEPQAPYHDWQSAVPDTSILPPPPSMGEDRSWAYNATEADAARGSAWCSARPLLAPSPVPSATLEAIEAGAVELMRPAQYIGSVRAVRRGVWSCASKRNSPDSCLMSTAPLYSALAHSPATFRRAKTVYFEVAMAPGGSPDDVGVALGFVAQPYPPFRLPGWERASVGVHGDDGRRYINDCWGGKEFTAPFRRGEVLGVGMVFAPRKTGDLPPAYGEVVNGGREVDVEVFFTRDGVKVGGWDLHEEADASQDRPVTGLEGGHDLFAAVGTFEKAEFEVRFDERDWLYRP